MKGLCLSLGSVLVAASCTSSTAPVAGQGPTSQVRVSDAARVADCQFVTSITESYHSGLLFAGTGLKQAQNEVLVAAGRQGATDIVWNSLNSGGVVQSATASAYRCPV